MKNLLKRSLMVVAAGACLGGLLTGCMPSGDKATQDKSPDSGKTAPAGSPDVNPHKQLPGPATTAK